MKETSLLAEAILEQMADAVIYADVSDTIQRWNRAAAALFGYNGPEALGENLDLIIPEHLRASHWHGFEAPMTTGVMKLPRPSNCDSCATPKGKKTLHRDVVWLGKGRHGYPWSSRRCARRNRTRRAAASQRSP